MNNKIQHYKDVVNYLNNIQNLRINNMEVKKVIIDEENKKVYVKKEAKNGKM